MSETVSLERIGATLRSIQAEQCSIRDENKLIRQALSDAMTVLMQRVANFEAYPDTRFDQRSIRLDQVNLRLDHVNLRFDQIEQGRPAT